MASEQLIKEMVVVNTPPALPVPAQSSTSPSSVPQSSGEAAEGPVEPARKDSSEECYTSTGRPRWASSVRVQMVKIGLYKKHSTDHTLLRGFSEYLYADLGNKNSKQEVEAVSRFMYYMDPSEPSLKFVREVEKVREYFSVLTDTLLSKLTVLSFWKSLNRFMKYIISSSGMRFKDPALYKDCKSFMDLLTGMAKNFTKEVTQKRFHGYGVNHTSVE